MGAGRAQSVIGCRWVWVSGRGDGWESGVCRCGRLLRQVLLVLLPLLRLPLLLWPPLLLLLLLLLPLLMLLLLQMPCCCCCCCWRSCS